MWSGATSKTSGTDIIQISVKGDGPVPDILIRDVPEDVIASLEQRARHLGLSRTEYLRRVLVRESADRTANATLDDWRAFAERHADLDDPEVMRQAWT